MKNEDSIILDSDTTFMSDLKLNRDTCSLLKHLYQLIYLKCMTSQLDIYVTVGAFTYVRGWVFFGEIFFQTK